MSRPGGGEAESRVRTGERGELDQDTGDREGEKPAWRPARAPKQRRKLTSLLSDSTKKKWIAYLDRRNEGTKDVASRGSGKKRKGK